MPLVTTESLITAASAAGTGLAAFNVITLEHAEAIVAGATAAGCSVILQISQNAVKFHGGRISPIAAAAQALAMEATGPVSLHLDHVEDEALVAAAAAAGFSSVMFDAGALPYPANVARTSAAATAAHADGLFVEAELGFVGGKSEAPLSAHAPGALTDPAEARDYVQSTGVDALAVAVGSSHAMTTRSAELDLTRIAELRSALTVPLVLHGSSGVPDAVLAAAVRAGIVKINIGTALNIAMTGAVRAFLAGDADAVDPRKYLALGRSAMAETVEHLCRIVTSPTAVVVDAHASE